MLTAPNGKIYVGSALNGFHERSRAYRNESAHNNIQNALKKYEAKNFVFSILESSNTWQKDKLQEREQHYMDTLLPFGARGYNVERLAGIVTPKNERRVSQFTRAGEPVASYESITWASVMARAHQSSINECSRGKLSSTGGYLWLYSENVTPQEVARRVKITASATSSNKRRVSQYTKAGEFVTSYPSVSEAARATGGNIGNISQCAGGKVLSSGGFIWLYSEDVSKQEIARRVERIASVTSDPTPRRVNQYTKAGEFIASFESIKDAARVTGASKSHISTCASGKRKSTGGFVWRCATPRLVTPVKAPERAEDVDTRETYLEAVAREWEQVSLVF